MTIKLTEGWQTEDLLPGDCITKGKLIEGWLTEDWIKMIGYLKVGYQGLTN